eukprot:9582192-Karenia_brevis.AAC.1
MKIGIEGGAWGASRFIKIRQDSSRFVKIPRKSWRRWGGWSRKKQRWRHVGGCWANTCKARGSGVGDVPGGGGRARLQNRGSRSKETGFAGCGYGWAGVDSRCATNTFPQ